MEFYESSWKSLQRDFEVDSTSEDVQIDRSEQFVDRAKSLGFRNVPNTCPSYDFQPYSMRKWRKCLFLRFPYDSSLTYIHANPESTACYNQINQLFSLRFLAAGRCIFWMLVRSASVVMHFTEDVALHQTSSGTSSNFDVNGRPQTAPRPSSRLRVFAARSGSDVVTLCDRISRVPLPLSLSLVVSNPGLVYMPYPFTPRFVFERIVIVFTTSNEFDNEGSHCFAIGSLPLLLEYKWVVRCAKAYPLKTCTCFC